MFLKAGQRNPWHIQAMLTAQFPDPAAESVVSHQGEVLLRRGATPAWVTYVDSGRVALGLMEDQVLAHQLGSMEGPLWLEATCAVLGLPSAVDAVAETEVLAHAVAGLPGLDHQPARTPPGCAA